MLMSRVMFDIVCTDERLSRDLDQVKSQDLEGKRGDLVTLGVDWAGDGADNIWDLWRLYKL